MADKYKRPEGTWTTASRGSPGRLKRSQRARTNKDSDGYNKADSHDASRTKGGTLGHLGKWVSQPSIIKAHESNLSPGQFGKGK